MHSQVTRFMVGALAALSLLGVVSFVQASSLTQAQIDSIMSLLQAFGADGATIANVEAVLGGTASQPASNCINLSQDLTLGATDATTGGAVTELQTFLQNEGYFTYSGPKGYYGFITAQAVGQYQMAKGLVSSSNDSAYGITGPQTRSSMGCATQQGNGNPNTSAGKTLNRSLSYAGVTRTYVLHLPAGYSSSKQYPLLLSFHGNGGTGAGQERITGFDTLADTNGFIVVYPDSNPTYQEGKQWQLAGTNNDVGFAEALISQLESDYSVDSARVYATGFSEGGGMAAALTCEYASHIAGFADVSTDMSSSTIAQCHPSKPVTTLYFHGTGDPVSPYYGGARGGTINGNTGSAADTAQFWASTNNCSAAPSTMPVSDTINTGTTTISVTDTKETWSGCKNNTSVTFYTIPGGGHAWPGNSSYSFNHGPVSSLNASAIIWQILSNQSVTSPTDNPPATVQASDATPSVEANVTFTATIPANLTYQWYTVDFGDGSEAGSCQQSVSLDTYDCHFHGYASPGVYTVKLNGVSLVNGITTVTAIATTTVTVAQTPVPLPPVTGGATLDQPNQVTSDTRPTISGTAAHSSSVYVDFLNSANYSISGSGAVPVAADGTFTATVVGTLPPLSRGTYKVAVYDTASNSLLALGNLTVTSAQSNAMTLRATPTSGAAPLSVTVGFNTAAYPQVNDWSHIGIDFGDGSGSSWAAFGHVVDCRGSSSYCASIADATAQHIYATPGTYTATLYVVPSIPTTCPASAAPCGTHLDSVEVTVNGMQAIAPTATITASPASIQSGGSTTLSWSSTNATNCMLSSSTQYPNGVGALPPQPVDLSGSQTSSPSYSTTYTLVCNGAADTQSATAMVTVPVESNPSNQAPALSVSVSGLSTRTVTAGSNGVTVARYVFDATQSGEDVELTRVRPLFTGTGPLNNCSFYNGSTPLQSGANVVNNVTTTQSTNSYVPFTFDTPLVIPKGTSVTLDLKCDVPSNATGSFSWGTYGGSANAVLFSAAGITSGKLFTPTASQNYGSQLSIAAPVPTPVLSFATSAVSSFDGSHFTQTDALPPSQAFTIAAWVKFTGNSCSVVLSDATDAIGNDLFLGVDGTHAYLRADKDGASLGGNSCLGGYPIPLPSSIANAWHHLTWVNDTTGSTLYLDGTKIGSATAGSNVGYQGPTAIGAFFDGSTGFYPHGSNFLTGSVSDIEYYTSALTADQVSQLYQSSTNPSTYDSSNSASVFEAVQSVLNQIKRLLH